MARPAMMREGTMRRSAVASEGENQRSAHFPHSADGELCQPAAKPVLSDSHHIVQVGRAGLPHSVVGAEDNLRRHSPNCGGDRRYGHTRKIGNRAASCEDQDRLLLVRSGKAVEPNLSPLYSSGQSATLSQTAGSSVESG